MSASSYTLKYVMMLIEIGQEAINTTCSELARVLPYITVVLTHKVCVESFLMCVSKYTGCMILD